MFGLLCFFEVNISILLFEFVEPDFNFFLLLNNLAFELFLFSFFSNFFGESVESFFLKLDNKFFLVSGSKAENLLTELLFFFTFPIKDDLLCLSFFGGSKNKLILLVFTFSFA